MNQYHRKFRSKLVLTTSLAVFTSIQANPAVVLGHARGIYATRAEAQQRASEIGCTAIHENNGRWMPCANEKELHQQLRKQ